MNPTDWVTFKRSGYGDWHQRLLDYDRFFVGRQWATTITVTTTPVLLVSTGTQFQSTTTFPVTVIQKR